MSENQMLPMQKDETVAKLYALRAGLSVIAENVDKIKASKAATKAREQKVASIQNKISENKQQQADARANYYRKLADLKKTIADGNLVYQEATETVSTRKESRAIVLIFSLLAIITLIFSIVLAEKTNFISLLLGLICTLFLLTPVSRVKSVDSEKYEAALNFIDMYEENNPALQKEIVRLSNEPSIPDYLLQAENSLLDSLKQTLQQNDELEKESEKQETALTEESKQIYSSLISTYTPFIVESDWKNIDLLIFYLETGRADTWKEALQLVDRQMQTDQITNAITQASAAIAQTMVRSTQALGSLMAQSFSTLVSANQEMLSETRLNNALLGQSNKTCEALLANVHYIYPYPIK